MLGRGNIGLTQLQQHFLRALFVVLNWQSRWKPRLLPFAVGVQIAQDHIIVSVDIGTQGCKAALYDENINKVSSSFRSLRLIGNEKVGIWQDPEEIYKACLGAIQELAEKEPNAINNVAAIGIDGQMAGIMGVDEDG